MANPNTKKKLIERLSDFGRQAGDALFGVSLSEASVQQVTKTAMDQVDRLPNFDTDYVGVEMIMGSTDMPVRTRAEIYQKRQFMVTDGLINTALRQHVQMALGGHESTGEVIFCEKKPTATADEKKFIDELAGLLKVLNENAHTVCFNAAAFGDGYTRIYTQKGQGVVATDSTTVYPPLVQPYELLGKTIGYLISTGQKLSARMDHLRVIRMKMPRMFLIPQMKVIENAQRINLEADSPEDMVPLASLAGGSFLDAAEQDFDNLYAALRGLVGQRISASIDENLLALNMADTTKEQAKKIKDNVEKMLRVMKTRAEEQVSKGIYSTSRHFHIMPVYNEKQLAQVSSFQGASNSGTGLSIEDVMFHAKKLAGTLGIDISMLGFADQLTGGLGEGGFNRTSSQAAERARILRTSFTQYANDMIDRHMLAKYGWCWPDDERPYDINFYGSIAALEAEKQATQERAMNKFAILVQVLAQLREMGLPTDMVEHMLAIQAQLDQEAAALYAKGMKDAKPPEPAGMGGGFPPGGDESIELIDTPGGGGNQNEENENG